MTSYYCGIGSRKTPPCVLRQMETIAIVAAQAGLVLRSGGAAGADTAFEQGCVGVSGEMEIYLPWKGFNGCATTRAYIHPPTKRAFEIASHFHPAWDRCSRAAKLLHARNSHQVLGKDCETPSKFVACWHQNTGGTMQAVRIAKSHGIHVYNLAEVGAYDQVLAAVQSLMEEK